MEITNSHSSGLLKGLIEDLETFSASVPTLYVGRVRTQSIPRGITMAIKIAQPMSVVRGPNRRRRTANIGESPADAMLAEPKLSYELQRDGVPFSCDNLQDTVCQTAAIEKPLIDITNARSKE